MFTFIVRRLLYSIPVLIAASFIIFTFVSISGDPLTGLRFNPHVRPRTIHRIEERKHLDKPLIVQYGYWVKDAVFHGFGTTVLGDEPIGPDLKRVFGNTVQLIVAAELLSILLAIGIGVYSAVRQYSPFDYTATTFSFVGFSTPIFWLALIAQMLVIRLNTATNTHFLFVSQLNSSTYSNFWVDRAEHLILPVLVLAVAEIAAFSRYMRASMLEVINSDYVRTARAKGLSERKVIFKHAFRNALIPLVTVVALNFGALFGGAIVTESVFSLDGMGLYFIHALGDRDVYPIMAWLMVTAIIVIVFNLFADILYGILDPRIRYE
ncbi:MAG: ABC transporter permease [Actinomycetota bacterium]|nr:ABC transporter permease [Actinomycetota bacterium]